MSLSIVIDMNLSPAWVDVLARQGWKSVHWSTIGDPKAPDEELVSWAIQNQHAVFTHDLDFGRLIALSRNARPSIIQIRAQDILPDRLGKTVVEAIQRFESLLETGALLTIDPTKARARALPLR